MNFDVFWLLASHHLSVLDMFVDISTLTFESRFDVKNNSHPKYKDLCTTGSLYANNFVRIDVSLNYPGKEMLMTIYGSKGTIQYNPLSKKSVKMTLYNKGYASLPPKLTDYEVSFRFNEMNNLSHALTYFKNLIEGRERSNVDRAIKITDILETYASGDLK